MISHYFIFQSVLHSPGCWVPNDGQPTEELPVCQRPSHWWLRLLAGRDVCARLRCIHTRCSVLRQHVLLVRDCTVIFPFKRHECLYLFGSHIQKLRCLQGQEWTLYIFLFRYTYSRMLQCFYGKRVRTLRNVIVGSHSVEVQCINIITICLTTFELLHFVIFHTCFCPELKLYWWIKSLCWIW